MKILRCLIGVLCVWSALGVGATTRAAAQARPAVLGWEPGVTLGLPPSSPLTIYFDRPMNMASVTAAWRLSPTARGSFSHGLSSLTFTPSGTLRPHTTYRLTLGSGARSLSGLPLAPFAVRFTTGDALRVLNVSPAAGTQEVPLGGTIAITFNHPMVPLAGVDSESAVPRGWSVSITPKLPGHGAWLGTSTWVYHPTGTLAPSTRYTVTVRGTVRDAWGERLGRTVRWSFRTAVPEIYSRSPHNDSYTVSPHTDVRVTFSQPMDPASTDRAFSIRAHGAPVPGTITWSGATLIFRPAQQLSGGALYHVTLTTAALSANRKGALKRGAHWLFRIAPNPRLIGTDPNKNGTAWASFFPLYGRGPEIPCCTPIPYSVTIQFNTPMSKSSLDEHLHITPTIGHLLTSLYENNGVWEYTIAGDFAPSSSYTVTIAPGVVDAFGRPLPGGGITFPFQTSEMAPSVALYGMPGIDAQTVAASSGQRVKVPMQVIDIPSIHFTLIKTTLYALHDLTCQYCLPAGTTVRTWSEDTSAATDHINNTTVQLKTRSGSPLPPGLYWLQAQAPDPVPGWNGSEPTQDWPPSTGEAVLINDVSVTAKSGDNGTLVWVNDTKTGTPLTGASVRLTDYNGAAIKTASTNSHGLRFFPGLNGNGRRPVYAAVVTGGGHFGMAQLYWNPNISSPTYFSWPWGGGSSSNGTYAYTDRPIYRPGQTVHFRAVLWKDSDAVYSLLRGKQVTVTVTDSRYKQIYRRTLTLDRFGAVHGAIHLAPNAPTGDFNLYAGIKYGPTAYTIFTVADYRKPEFLTTVKPAAQRYAQGQTATVKVSVRYVFGAPVTHQHLHWTAYATFMPQSPPGWDGYTFVNWEQLWTEYQQLASSPYNPSGGLGKAIASGTGRTNGKGTMTIQMPVNLRKSLLDRQVVVEVTATDENSQSVSGRATIGEFHSDLAIGVDPQQNIVDVGHAAVVNVVAVHQDGTPVAGTQLTAVINKRTYSSKLVAGNSVTEWKPVPHDTPVATQTLTTDASGKATLTFTPTDGGEYYIVISGKDAAGNPTQTSLSIDVSANGATDWSGMQNTSITLTPDHSTYSVGQTAHIFVPSPFPDPTVLVTVERGTIRKYWTTTFSGTSGTVGVPLGIDALPNEYVSVTLYHGWRGNTPPEWRTGEAELHLRLNPRHIAIKLVQNPGRHHPGDPVTYTIRTETLSGKPVSAEVSLALVDTAVLALKDETNADILQALYAERSLDVTTASEGAISIDNLTQQPDFAMNLQAALSAHSSAGAGVVNGAAPPVPATGGGGPGAQAPVYAAAKSAARAPASTASATIRSHFADTALWRGAVTTNASGIATISVRLPDNTTTWRLDARGIDAATAVGGATLKTLATRDLVLTPDLPRFFTQGDTLRVGVSLNNRLSRAVTADVTVSARGLRLAARPRTVTVPAKGERLLLFPATVPVSAHAILTARAVPHSAGVQGDAVQAVVPVHAPLTDETTATTGQVYDRTRQLVVVPRDAVAVPGELTVSVQSSITAGLGNAFAQLKPEPSESNDDVANRVLAAASLRTLPQPITGLSVTSYRHLPLTIALGVQKLLDTQFYDGGWPWFTDWYTQQSDPMVTADAVQALVASGRHGPLVAQALGRARSYLTGQLGQVSPQLRAHLLAVLATTGSWPRSNAEALYNDSIRRLHLDAGSLADLGTALQRTGDAKKAQSILASLQASARVSATGAHWESGDAGFWGGPPVANTAVVLTTLLRLSPNDPLEPAAARWLMLARQGDGWDCGRDTAQAIAALAAYARAAQEGTADYHYRVTVLRKAMLQGWYTPASSTAARRTTVPISSLHRPGATAVDISRSGAAGTFGTGPLYYLARLHYFLPANDIPALNEGVSVSRRFLTLAGRPVTSVPVGSALKVQLTIHTDQTLVYLDVRDPLCSGCEPIDESLNTSQQGIAPRQQWIPWQRAGGVQDLTWYLIHSDLRDDHVSLYAYYLPPGTYRYTYLVQATVAGTYAVAPTHVSEHFFPEVFGRSNGQVLTVR